MIGFCPLASGSKGNSIFFGTKNTRILIDAGIRASKIIKNLAEIDVAIDTIDAIVVTHEHIDHIQGVALLSEKYNIPVFANGETAKAIVEITGIRPKFKIFATGEPFEFGDLEIEPFSIPHDTIDPVAFIIQTGKIKTGFCTDLGYPTSLVKKKLENCHYLYLEANHEPALVHACNRPNVYKTRVLGRQGHLSNEQCKDLLKTVLHKELRHVYFAHLSSECNREELVFKAVEAMISSFEKKIDLSIAYQDRISHKLLFQ